MTKTLEDLEQIAELANNLEFKLNDNPLSRGEEVESMMKGINEVIGGYGVEALTEEDHWISHFWQNTIGLYINMGDTYDNTIIYDTVNDEFVAGNWGDFVSEYDQDHGE